MMVLCASSLMAFENLDVDHDKSLFALEVGGASLDYDKTDVNTNPATFTSSSQTLGSAALKLGAESKNYRIFLFGRYSKDTDNVFDYIMHYGVEVDYFFHFSQYANFFIGVDGGVSYMKFTIDGEPRTRTIDSPFYGGCAGFNFHATRDIDLEFGGRYEAFADASNINDGVEYDLTGEMSAYASVIFKFQLD